MIRRRFLQGMTAACAFTAAYPYRRALAASTQPVLSGTAFQLDLTPVPLNVTGRPMTATGINGQMPGPILRWREGDTVTIAVTNRLATPSSIHWHGVLVPAQMDGVPGFSYYGGQGIAPGETFTYRFDVQQHGTYWYHAHDATEPTGILGPLIIEPKGGFEQAVDRDYVIVLSDWSDESPVEIIGNLKFQSDYYNYGQRTLGSFIKDASRDGLGAAISDRLRWGRMRMSPTDLLDISGATYTYLVNGQPPAANWTALFRPGERVRLRFIAAGAMTIFDVRIPGLPMTVVQADGNDVVPVTVDEFRISAGETYDVIVEPRDDQAYTIFAQALDRSGYARATLAPRPGMAAAVPPTDPRPIRTMADMGMGGMAGMKDMSSPAQSPAPMSGMHHMPGMEMEGTGASDGMHHGASMTKSSAKMSAVAVSGVDSSTLRGQVAVDNVAAEPKERLDEAGVGLDGNGRKVLRYVDLRSVKRGKDPRPPSREIVLHLTGNMERFIWGIDGKTLSEAEPIVLQHGERVRFTLINDTMMEHPMHLHGMWSELENGNGEYRPYKHTVLVKPGEKLSFLVSAEALGRWAFHCHMLYHMELGMFREVRVV